MFLTLFNSVLLSKYNLDSTEVIIIKGNKCFYLSPSGDISPVDSSNFNINEFYTNYYRKIYNDSSITNPNYILPTKSNNDIIFYMDISEFIKNNKYGFKLEDFLKIDNKTYKLKNRAKNKFKKE